MDKYWILTKTLPNEENQKVVNDFLLSLKLSNRSKLTIDGYRVFLERFFSEVKGTYSEIGSDVILDWFQTNQTHLKESTYRLRLYILSSFYNFCVEDSRMERSPIKSRWFPRVPYSLPKYIEKGDVAKLRLEAERHSIRSQALIEFMLTSGCRIGEVHALNIEDVDIEERTAMVVGKGKKIRYVYFSDKCAVLLERYKELREDKPPSSPLFVTLGRGERLSIRRMQKIMQKIGEESGISTRLHPHRLRHTFATTLLVKGADMAFIANQLGHEDIFTTQNYARLTNQAIISQYRKLMG